MQTLSLVICLPIFVAQVVGQSGTASKSAASASQPAPSMFSKPDWFEEWMDYKSNVLLGRDLIEATKKIEDSQLRSRLLSTAKVTFEAAKSSFAAEANEITRTQESLTDYQSRLEKEAKEMSPPEQKASEGASRQSNESRSAPAGNTPPPAAPTSSRTTLNRAPTVESSPVFDSRLLEQVRKLLNQQSQWSSVLQDLRGKVWRFEQANSRMEFAMRSAELQLESLKHPISTGSPGQLTAIPLAAPTGGYWPDGMAPFQPTMGTTNTVLSSENIPEQIERNYSDEFARIANRIKEIIDSRKKLEEKAPLLTKEIQQLSENLQSEINTASVEKTALERRLGDRDERIKQLNINLWLVGCVFVMIFTMIYMFRRLTTMQGHLATVIVEQRVLVEVLSMGFLLLTIIILGTGRLLNAEGLAGLLGTIAGYIFARKTAELAEERQRRETTNPRDGGPRNELRTESESSVDRRGKESQVVPLPVQSPMATGTAPEVEQIDGKSGAQQEHKEAAGKQPTPSTAQENQDVKTKTEKPAQEGSMESGKSE